MTEHKKTAKFVARLTGFTGEARLYKLSPPIAQTDFYGTEVAQREYVIVSATVVPFGGPETYIFPATEGGEIADWGELDGSYKGGLDHATALLGAGYEVQS